MGYVRIVQGNDSERSTKTQGTKVLLEDGSELQGVYRIVLTAEVDSLWEAEIHCHTQAVDIRAEAKIMVRSWWSRLKDLFKRSAIDVTALDSTSRRYR